MKRMKRIMAGCLVIGLYASPGLARADETKPTAAQPAPAKAGLLAKAKARQTAADKRALKKRPLTTGTDLLADPDRIDPPAPVLARPVLASNIPASNVPASNAGARVPGPRIPGLRIPLPPLRPKFSSRDKRPTPAAAASQGDDVLQTGSIPMAPAPIDRPITSLFSRQPDKSQAGKSQAGKSDVDALISKHAARYRVPESLLRRVVARESGFNPQARHGSFMGLMQMRLDTARGMGYRGGAAGLLDADTNLCYGAAYLANAYRVAGGSQDRAMRLYSSGYYYEAKRKGLLPQLIKGTPSP